MKIAFIVERQILDTEYFKFVSELISSYSSKKRLATTQSAKKGDDKAELRLIKYAVKFMLKLYLQANDKEGLLLFIDNLKPLLETNNSVSDYRYHSS